MWWGCSLPPSNFKNSSKLKTSKCTQEEFCFREQRQSYIHGAKSDFCIQTFLWTMQARAMWKGNKVLKLRFLFLKQNKDDLFCHSKYKSQPYCNKAFQKHKKDTSPILPSTRWQFAGSYPHMLELLPTAPQLCFFRSWWGWSAVPRRALLLIPYLISPTADRPCLLLPGKAQTKSRPSPSGTCQDGKIGMSSRSWLSLQHWGFPLLNKEKACSQRGLWDQHHLRASITCWASALRY